jgi:uncharacterized protein (DUF1697 family)
LPIIDVQEKLKPDHSDMKYIALIRAINVGGNSIIKMADLKKLFESAGLNDVATYIQTGNVLFSTTRTDLPKLSAELEKKLEMVVKKKAKIMILTPEELKAASAGNPFEPEKNDREQRCHLMFLSAEPDKEKNKTLKSLEGVEYRFHLQGKVLYYAYSREFDGKRRTIDLEKVLGTEGTARTWKVVDKLVYQMKGNRRYLVCCWNSL